MPRRLRLPAREPWLVVSPPQTITWAISLAPIVIGEQLATTLWSSLLHPAGLADTHLVAVDCMEQVTAGVQLARRVARPLIESGLTTRGPILRIDAAIAVIGSQVVIVSPRQTITWAVSLDSIVIVEQMATALSGT
jgi:hypothetical protein